MMRIHPVLKKVLVGLASLSFAFIAVMGFAHTKAGRPLLAVIGPAFGMGPHAHAGAGRCPFGFDVKQDPAAKDAARARFSATHHGDKLSEARLALGFALGETTKSDVLAWAASHAVKCETPRVGADLDCSDIPSNLLPGDHDGAVAVKDLWLNFDSSEKLDSVIAIRREKDPKAIEAAFRANQNALTEKAGAPSGTQGDPSSQWLAAGLLRQASVEYRFQNYYALARASNMGDGYVLTEEYRSLQ